MREPSQSGVPVGRNRVRLFDQDGRGQGDITRDDHIASEIATIGSGSWFATWTLSRSQRLGVAEAALDVADYASAVNWAAQTALRDVIGKTLLSDMLEGREKISDELRRIIDVRTEPWGINVISVEVKDVLIPAGLEDAMSMQAQAERERQARFILGDSERQIAEKFGEAAKTYADNPTAFICVR